ncbi:MAG: sulfatase-like hydrolase/transferase [Elusimicrobiota bacterium]
MAKNTQRGYLVFIKIYLCLALALIALRYQIARDIGLHDYATLRAAGFFIGASYDSVLALFPIAIIFLTGVVLAEPFILGGLLAGFLAWLINLAGLAYFRFYGSTLEWWVARSHWSDIFYVSGSGIILCSSLGVLVSLIFLSVSFYPSISWGHGRRRLLSRARMAVVGLVIVALALLIKKNLGMARGINFGGQNRGSILSSQILFRWFKDAGKNRVGLADAGDKQKDNLTAQEAKKVLEHYASSEGASFLPSYPAELRTLPSRQEVAAIRKAIGIPADRRPSIIFLFVESLRSYELAHPGLGPKIFPNLSRYLKSNAIVFEQAYVSQLTAGETVKGEFAAQCSMLPDSFGPAAYIAHPTAKIDCIQSLLKDAGYQTVWVNGFTTSFHLGFKHLTQQVC